LPYINIGVANIGLADANNKNKGKGKEETPKLRRKKHKEIMRENAWQGVQEKTISNIRKSFD
jgi:hypothetical protein